MTATCLVLASLSAGPRVRAVPSSFSAGTDGSACYLGFVWSKKELTYSYPGAHRYLANAAQGTRNWNSADIGLRIVPAAAGRRGDIDFVDVDDPTNAGLLGFTVPGGREYSKDVALSATGGLRVQTAPITIFLNRAALDSARLGDAEHQDFMRTYTTTHELGHALGLQHPNVCGQSTVNSIMLEGTADIFVHPPTFNTPRDYDIQEARALYRH